MHGERMNSYKILVGKTEIKPPLERHRCRWKDNAELDLREIRWSRMGWIDLTQDRDQRRAPVNTVMNLRVPQNAGKFLRSCAIGDFSKKAQLHELAIMRCEMFYSFVSVATDYCTAPVRNSTERPKINSRNRSHTVTIPGPRINSNRRTLSNYEICPCHSSGG
jgi:hypothetical protein